MDPSTFHTRASLILTGLGFNKVTINQKTKDMSGGWQMRVALTNAPIAYCTSSGPLLCWSRSILLSHQFCPGFEHSLSLYDTASFGRLRRVSLHDNSGLEPFDG